MLSPVRFYETATYRCSYINGLRARSLLAAPASAITAQNYGRLIDLGFRRSGTLVYRPHCDTCQACQPIRVDAQRFQASRSLRRTFKRFQYLRTHIKPLVYSDEHYALYRQYQAVRHSGSVMDNDDKAQYIEFILSSQVNSFLVEFRDPTENNALKMVALMDEIHQGLSAVYTFFDPHTAGLGTYAILWQLQQCQQRHLPWLYLGYWVQQSPKMAYKTRFTPYQLFINNEWTCHYYSTPTA